MGELANTLITILFTAVITNLLTRWVKKEETEKSKAQTIQTVIDLWQGLVEDLTAQVKSLTNEVELLRAENISLKTEMQNTRAENRSLKFEMQKLEKILNEKNA